MVPMRNFGWTVMAVSLFYLPFAAEAQFKTAQSGFNSSIRREAPATTAQVQSPAPVVNVSVPKAEPPVVNVAPGPAPVVNVSSLAPTFTAEVQSWIQTSLLALVALFLGKLGFKPAPVPVAAAGPLAGALAGEGGLPEQANLLLRLRDKVSDPDTKAKIDTALLAAVSSGIPSTLVRTGLSAIPVAGPLASNLEPLLHEAFAGFLKSRLEINTRPPNA